MRWPVEAVKRQVIWCLDLVVRVCKGRMVGLDGGPVLVLE